MQPVINGQSASQVSSAKPGNRPDSQADGARFDEERRTVGDPWM